jgi:hypothetical protein
MVSVAADNVTASIVSAVFAVVEMFLLMGGDGGYAQTIQFLWLALATVFCIVIMDFKYSAVPSEYKSSFWFLNLDKDDRFEVACFAVGWIFLYIHPGIAAFRTIRVFRYFAVTAQNFDTSRLSNFYKVMWFTGRRSRFYLLKLEQEIANSMVFPLICFYLCLTLLIGAIVRVMVYDGLGHQEYYIDTVNNQCISLSKCISTVFRLSVFESQGIEFVVFMLNTKALKYQAIVLILYALCTSVLIWNHFIGLLAEAIFKPLNLMVTPVSRKNSSVHPEKRATSQLSITTDGVRRARQFTDTQVIKI